MKTLLVIATAGLVLSAFPVWAQDTKSLAPGTATTTDVTTIDEIRARLLQSCMAKAECARNVVVHGSQLIAVEPPGPQSTKSTAEMKREVYRRGPG